MTEVLQANIFFFITAAAIIAFTIFLCVAVFYLIKILRTVSRLTDRIEAGSENIAKDIDNLRSYVAGGALLSQAVGFFTRGRSRTRHRAKSEDAEL